MFQVIVRMAREYAAEARGADEADEREDESEDESEDEREADVEKPFMNGQAHSENVDTESDYSFGDGETTPGDYSEPGTSISQGTTTTSLEAQPGTPRSGLNFHDPSLLHTNSSTRPVTRRGLTQSSSSSPIPELLRVSEMPNSWHAESFDGDAESMVHEDVLSEILRSYEEPEGDPPSGYSSTTSLVNRPVLEDNSQAAEMIQREADENQAKVDDTSGTP